MFWSKVGVGEGSAPNLFFSYGERASRSPLSLPRRSSMAEAELKYPVGRVLDVNNAPFRLRILRHLAVFGTRRSRVFAAIVEGDENATGTLPLGSEVCIKIFDYDLVRQEDVHDADSKAEFCSRYFHRESHAYAQLAALAGAEIPLFYRVCNIGPYRAILFEYVNQVDLSQYLVSSNEEMERIQSKGDSALAKMHANRVYHSDIRAENIMWIPSTQRFVIFDFDLSTVFSKDDDEDEVEYWKKGDRRALQFTLRYKVSLNEKVQTGRKLGQITS
jgi:serine/threonine protein kinase